MKTKLVLRHLPERKRGVLCIEQGNQGIIIATFRNVECETYFEHFLRDCNCIVTDCDNFASWFTMKND